MISRVHCGLVLASRRAGQVASSTGTARHHLTNLAPASTTCALRAIDTPSCMSAFRYGISTITTSTVTRSSTSFSTVFRHIYRHTRTTGLASWDTSRQLTRGSIDRIALATLTTSACRPGDTGGGKKGKRKEQQDPALLGHSKEEMDSIFDNPHPPNTTQTTTTSFKYGSDGMRVDASDGGEGAWIERESTLATEHRWPYRRHQERKPFFAQAWVKALMAFGTVGVVILLAFRDNNAISGKPHWIVPMSIEDSIGTLALGAILSDVPPEAILPFDNPNYLFIRAIGEIIAEKTGVDYEWEYVLVESPEVNAFCLPGGKIIVYTGLLNALNDQDLIAQVLAHEISHALCRHSVEGLLSNFMTAIVALFAVGEISQGAFVFLSTLMALPLSREHEAEADQIGLVLMSRCCFDPTKAPLAYEKFKQIHEDAGVDNSGISSYFSTHPPDADRIEAMKQQLDHAKREAKQAGCNGKCLSPRDIGLRMRAIKARLQQQQQQQQQQQLLLEQQQQRQLLQPEQQLEVPRAPGSQPGR